MADVKWSDNTAFPVVTTPLGTDQLVGLFSANNGKISVDDLKAAISPTVIAAARVFWVATNGNDTTGDGSITNPYQTYNKAWFQALINGANSANPYQIVMCPGSYTINGDFNIDPYISVKGFSNTATKINILGQILLGGNWGTTSNPKCVVSDIALSAVGNANLTFTLAQNFTELTFMNVDFSGTSSINVTGSGTVSAENVNFINSDNHIIVPLDFSLTNANSLMYNCILGVVVLTNSNSNYANQLQTYSCSSPSSVSVVSTSSQSALYAPKSTITTVITLNGANSFFLSDVDSYAGIPTFLGGATISNVSIQSMSDGLYVNPTSFTPTNYTVTAPNSSVVLDSITSHLNGINIALSDSGGTPISQLLWVNEADGDDANNGTINSPLQTYEAARLIAVASASPTNLYLINIIGDQNITGDFVISPYVNVNQDSTGSIIASGNIVLDAAWSSISNQKVFIDKLTSATSVNLSYTSGIHNYVYFRDCNFSGSDSFNVSGPVGATANTCGAIIMRNINSDGTTFLSGVNASSADLFLQDAKVDGDVNAFVVGDDANPTAFINNTQIGGSLNLSWFGFSGVLTGIVRNSTISINISGASNVSLNIDSSSYSGLIGLSSGATMAQVTIVSLSDGVNQTTYTPVNYTPTGDTNYLADSLTGNLRGIDEKLLIKSWDGSQTPVDVTAGTGISITAGEIDAVVNSWDGASTAVDVVAGTGIDITNGTISATGTPATVVSFAEMYIAPINSKATDVGGTNNWFKVEAGPAGPSPDYSGYNVGLINGFTFSNGRLTCNVAATQKYKISWVGVGLFGSGSPQLVNFQIVLNGSTASSNSSLTSISLPVGGVTTDGVTISLQGGFNLGMGDYIECYLQNPTGGPQNPIVKYTNIFITPLSVAGSSPAFVWNTITTNTSLAPNEGYLTNSAGMLTLTLPVSFVAGEIYAVSGVGSGGWHITQNSGQQIITENGTTTLGAGGYLESGVASPKDSVTLVAIDTATLKVINSEGSAIIVV